jgi:hypothetical protein
MLTGAFGGGEHRGRWCRLRLLRQRRNPLRCFTRLA